MLRTASIIGISLFLLSHAMLFFSQQHDPINASVMMLASILIALGFLRFFGAPYAPLSNRLGIIFWIGGWFLNALLHFDIMALGLTPAFSHQEKLLWSISHLCFIAAAGSFFFWMNQDYQSQRKVALVVLGITIGFTLIQQFAQNTTLTLIAALIFAAALVWFAIFKIEKY